MVTPSVRRKLEESGVSIGEGSGYKLPPKDNVKFSRKDSEYKKAYENKDESTAQRLVDEAANASGFKTKVYHGTNEKFNSFKSNPFIKEINGVSKIKGYFSTSSLLIKRTSYGKDILAQIQIIPSLMEMLSLTM